MSGFLPKNVALFNLSSSEAADWSIFRVDWEHRVALSCSAHSKEIVSFLAGYGFASMQREQKGLEMTSVDSKWWLTRLWRVDTSPNAVKSQLTWQSQLMCSLNQSTPEIHNNLLSKTQYSTCSTYSFAQRLHDNVKLFYSCTLVHCISVEQTSFHRDYGGSLNYSL